MNLKIVFENRILFTFRQRFILTVNPLPFLFQQLSIQHRKNEVSEMIESKNDASKNLEKALQALEQTKQRAANEKKNRNFCKP